MTVQQHFQVITRSRDLQDQSRIQRIAARHRRMEAQLIRAMLRRNLSEVAAYFEQTRRHLR